MLRELTPRRLLKSGPPPLAYLASSRGVWTNGACSDGVWAFAGIVRLFLALNSVKALLVSWSLGRSSQNVGGDSGGLSSSLLAPLDILPLVKLSNMQAKSEEDKRLGACRGFQTADCSAFISNQIALLQICCFVGQQCFMQQAEANGKRRLGKGRCCGHPE